MLPYAASANKMIKKYISKWIPTTVLLCMSMIAAAQQTAETAAGKEVQMADGLRSSGKIYVVVAVLLTVLSGLFLYIIRLDRKISKMEKK